jgi:hypothetical protein
MRNVYLSPIHYLIMNEPRKIFHVLSYVQYPLLLVAVFYCYRPLIVNLDTLWVDLNKGLVFLGLGIGFSTLQDTARVQNKWSKRIYENPRYTRWFLGLLLTQVVLFMVVGLVSLFSAHAVLRDLSMGLVSIAIGMIGMLKAAIEMAEHHRKRSTVQPAQS